MPTKSTYLVAFLCVFAASVGLHRYVYQSLRRVIRRDFPRFAPRGMKYVAAIFILMELPFAFLFFRSHLHREYHMLTLIGFYSFTLWQVLMWVWSIVLFPQTLWRTRRRNPLLKPFYRLFSKRRGKNSENPFVDAQPAYHPASKG